MDFHFMIDSLPKLISVIPMTIYISVVSVIVGFALAAIIAIIREKKIKVLSQIFAVLVSFVRGTPILVQLYVIYYGLPQFLYYLQNQGVNVKLGSLPHLVIAISAYSLNAAANLSETIRSAYHSVDKDQYQAALSVGMTPSLSMRRIVIPQLIPNLIPNFSNFFLDLIKDTALVYNIGIIEIMAKSNIIASFGFKYLETYLDALLLYLVICFVFGKILSLTETYVTRRVFSGKTHSVIKKTPQVDETEAKVGGN